jgi:hypothetical protein
MKDEESARAYQRGGHLQGEVKISRDNVKWADVEIMDIGSGGLLFKTSDVYKIGESLSFDLNIRGFFSEFNLQCTGTIRNEKSMGGHNYYGIAFTCLDPDKKIIIDENVVNDRPLGGNPYNPD